MPELITRYRRCFLALATLAVLSLPYGRLFYHRLLFYSADSYAFYFTQLRYWFGEFAAHRAIAFWNPYTNVGTGFLYNTTNALFYPFHALGFVLSPLTLYQGLWGGHLALLACGVARWGRRAGASWENRALVTVLFVASPFTSLFGTGGFNYLYAMTWAVWLLSELEGTPRNFGRLFLFWTLLLFSGEPFTAIFLGVFLSWLFWRESKPRAVGFWAGSALLGILLYGHGILALPYSTRHAGLDPKNILSFSFHPARLLTFLSPYFFGSPLRDTFGPGFINSSPNVARFLFDTPYLPTVLLLLIGFGMRRTWRERKARPWLLGAGIALILSFGNWGPLRFLCYVPPFSMFRYPEKFTIVAVLFSLHFAFRQRADFLKELADPVTKIVLLAVIALSTVSRDNELPITLSAIAMLGGLVAFEKRRLSYPRFGALWVASAVLQCWWATSPQRTVPTAKIDTVSPAAEYIASELPESSLLRFEITPHVVGEDYPHRYWIYGTNMLHHRSTVFGYDSYLTPFIDSSMKRLSVSSPNGDQSQLSVLSASQVTALIKLTALERLVVSNEVPIGPLMPSVEKGAKVFRVAKQTEKWTALAPYSGTTPLWWFSDLSSAEPGRDLLHWPPTVKKDRAFFRGIERDARVKDVHCPLSNAEIDPNQGKPLSATAIKWTGDNQFDFTFEAPCEGWTFFSQTALPGWRLFIAGEEQPLYRANDTFMAFQVPKGTVTGYLKYAPFKALYEALIGRWF